MSVAFVVQCLDNSPAYKVDADKVELGEDFAIFYKETTVGRVFVHAAAKCQIKNVSRIEEQ